MFIAKPFRPNLKRRGRGLWLLASARCSFHSHMPPRSNREVGLCKRECHKTLIRD